MNSPLPRGRPRGRLTAALVLLLALLAGGVAGVALDRLVLLPRHRSGPDDGMRRPPLRHREFRNRFTRELGLTAQQQRLIDSIMDRQGREIRDVRRQVQPQLDSIITRTRREVDAVLTPEQREKAAQIRRRHPRSSKRESEPRGPRGLPPEGPPP